MREHLPCACCTKRCAWRDGVREQPSDTCSVLFPRLSEAVVVNSNSKYIPTSLRYFYNCVWSYLVRHRRKCLKSKQKPRPGSWQEEMKRIKKIKRLLRTRKVPGALRCSRRLETDYRLEAWGGRWRVGWRAPVVVALGVRRVVRSPALVRITIPFNTSVCVRSKLGTSWWVIWRMSLMGDIY